MRQWLDHELDPALSGGSCPIRLRRDHEVVDALHVAFRRDHRPEDELPIFSIDHEDGGLDVDRIARLRMRLDPPVLGDLGKERPDVVVEVGCSRSIELDGPPCDRGVRSEGGSLAVEQIGDDHDHLGVLVEAVGELRQSLTHIFDAGLLGDHQPRDVLELLMEPPHESTEDQSVTHARVEDAKSIGSWSDVACLFREAGCRHRLFIRGSHEHPIGGACIEEAVRGGAVRHRSDHAMSLVVLTVVRACRPK